MQAIKSGLTTAIIVFVGFWVIAATAFIALTIIDLLRANEPVSLQTVLSAIRANTPWMKFLVLSTLAAGITGGVSMIAGFFSSR